MSDELWLVEDQPTETKQIAILGLFPPGFDIGTLLTFLPDVELKKKLAKAVAEALAADVTTDEGLLAVDAAMVDILRQIDYILACFDGTEASPGPTRLAKMLHSRLTGLRGDFTSEAQTAIATLRRRVVDERRRRQQIADDLKRVEQERADRELRESMQRVAEEAKSAGVDEAVVEEIKQQAAVAQAPPVQLPPTTPKMNAGTRQVWKCRFKGSTGAPNPTIAEMTPAQQVQFRAICAKIGSGELKELSVLAGLNWSYLNRRAASEQTTLDLPELEAFDEGGLNVRRK